MEALSVQKINMPVSTRQNTTFRSVQAVMPTDRHDQFIKTDKSDSTKKAWWIAGGVTLLGVGAFFAHKAGWFKRSVDKAISKNDILNIKEFKKVDEAKEYFEALGIKTEFRDVTEEHIPLLNRIKENLKQLKEMEIKIDKPDSINISNWQNEAEYREVLSNRGVKVNDYIPNYHALCATNKQQENHIFINSNITAFDKFRHEMGHANYYRGMDSFWEAKGMTNTEHANKQLEILGSTEKMYDGGLQNLTNIIQFKPDNASRYIFPNSEMKSIYVDTSAAVNKMQTEVNCYNSSSIEEQCADIFEGLLQGKKYSDEVMLYYDFAGGARIPKLNINGKTYDEYIESLYNNQNLIAKLRENIILSRC